MNPHTENETWIVETGDRVIQKKARAGSASLNDRERLIYCLWTADYMMRNAGDFANARALYPAFQRDAVVLAAKLRCSLVQETFSLPLDALQSVYFDRFERMCDELQRSDPGADRMNANIPPSGA